MGKMRGSGIVILVSALLLVSGAALAQNLMVQCPGDTDGDMIPDLPGYENVVCKHVTAGDGYAVMPDGKLMYTFGFSEVPAGTTEPRVFAEWQLKAEFTGPHIVLKEGQELYLNLTNVGMVARPDLFDAHSVHWHGIPNQGSIFDGLPESAPTVVIGATFPYYYATAGRPGTYFYHCHVEVSEHMQMGMIGALDVLPAQDGTPIGGYTKFAYNDGDGSTGYDVSKTLILAGFDSNFHDKHIGVQPLPFADMLDDYHTINGRGYPDTINPNPLGSIPENNNHFSQKHDSVITVNQNQRLLLRIANISTTHLFTVRVLGIPMKVVGLDAKLLRNGATDLYFETDSVTVSGGQATDVLLDTTNVAPGTYFFYTTNVGELINGGEERGGMMTEIVVCPPGGCA